MLVRDISPQLLQRIMSYDPETGLLVWNQQIHLGVFPTKDEAIAARRAAEERFGFHKNHGSRPAAARRAA